MKPERYRQVKEIFAAAVECEAAERTDFLARACASDEELRMEVESLLAHDEPAEDFIEESAFEVAARLLADDEAQPLKEGRIGPYKVVREIGRGGMGVVYLAARDDDHFRKEVAIKLIKRGMDTDAVVRRFRNERQILAGFEHPFIARLLDGGANADGLPFLVMEYVAGTPLTDYCDRQGLTTNERLQLFRSICAAVEHAHQNLIVHRDLKPTNILITNDGTPKLLDFGIAKVLDPVQPDLTVEQTRPNLRALTPDYASPEQLRGQKITTASDIYSLGVILYELLTGTRPYNLKDRSPEEMLHIICDTEPTRPSEAGSIQSGSERVTTDRQRKTDTRAQTRSLKSLKGDLDNIVLTALRKEPARRYKTVEQFSEDIRRYLTGLPVIARKDTFSYRASKFIGRNRFAVAATAIVVLAILAGLFVALWQAKVARAERNRAQAAQARAERINAFLETALTYSDPSSATAVTANKRDATINQMLDDVVPRIEMELADQPDVRASVQRAVGVAYAAQGRAEDSDRYLKSALQTQLEIYGEDHTETARTLFYLGTLQNLRGDRTGGEQTINRALAFYRRAGKQADQKSYVGALLTMVYIVWAKGDYAQAETLYREALAASDSLQKGDREIIGALKSALGTVRWAQGRLDEAADLLRNAVAEYRALPYLRYPLAIALKQLAKVLTHKNEFDESLAALRESEAILREMFGAESIMLEDNLYEQAYTLCLQGKDYAEAERLLKLAEDIHHRYTPQDKVGLANLDDARGMILTRTGRLAEGERYNRQALELYQRLIARGANGITLSRIHLSESLIAQKKYEEAERILLEAYKDASEVQGAQHWRAKDAARALVELYKALNRSDEAARYQALT
jgi:serine/threonine-protein kinase